MGRVINGCEAVESPLNWQEADETPDDSSSAKFAVDISAVTCWMVFLVGTLGGTEPEFRSRDVSDLDLLDGVKLLEEEFESKLLEGEELTCRGAMGGLDCRGVVVPDKTGKSAASGDVSMGREPTKELSSQTWGLRGEGLEGSQLLLILGDIDLGARSVQ